MKIPVFVTNHPYQWRRQECLGLTLDDGWSGFLVGATDAGFLVQDELCGDIVLVPHPYEGGDWLLAQDSDEFRRIVAEYHA